MINVCQFRKDKEKIYKRKYVFYIYDFLVRNCPILIYYILFSLS